MLRFCTFLPILEHCTVAGITNTHSMYSRQSQTVYSQSLSLSNELVIPTSRKPPAVTFKTWNSFCRIFCAWCYFPSSGIYVPIYFEKKTYFIFSCMFLVFTSL